MRNGSDPDSSAWGPPGHPHPVPYPVYPGQLADQHPQPRERPGFADVAGQVHHPAVDLGHDAHPADPIVVLEQAADGATQLPVDEPLPGGGQGHGNVHTDCYPGLRPPTTVTSTSTSAAGSSGGLAQDSSGDLLDLLDGEHGRRAALQRIAQNPTNQRRR